MHASVSETFSSQHQITGKRSNPHGYTKPETIQMTICGVFHWIISASHLSLRERSLHVLQQTGQILLTVTHHQKQTEIDTHKHTFIQI